MEILHAKRMHKWGYEDMLVKTNCKGGLNLVYSQLKNAL